MIRAPYTTCTCRNLPHARDTVRSHPLGYGPITITHVFTIPSPASSMILDLRYSKDEARIPRPLEDPTATGLGIPVEVVPFPMR
eukprot:2121352-Pyramimonas_sp.AAC.1